MNNEKVYQFYQNNKADCFISVSSSEGVPVSIMEVLSFSIPVIATNVGGVSEIVNNENGILLSDNPSIVNISNAIEKMSSLNSDEINKKRKSAYKTWSQKYNAEKNYLNFINKIDEIDN